MSETAEQIEIRRDDAAGKYEISVDGTVAGFADYTDHGLVRELPHTVVDKAFGGRGLAGKLVGYALEDIRSAGKQVRPTCSFVNAYIDKHPEYADLREQA